MNLEVLPDTFKYVLDVSLIHNSSYFSTVTCSCFLTVILSAWTSTSCQRCHLSESSSIRQKNSQLYICMLEYSSDSLRLQYLRLLQTFFSKLSMKHERKYSAFVCFLRHCQKRRNLEHEKTVSFLVLFSKVFKC